MRKMYSIYPRTEYQENNVCRYLLYALRMLGVERLQVIYSEDEEFTSNAGEMNLLRDWNRVEKALERLRTDLGFFTLGYPNKILIIPFEGGQFNLIVSEAAKLPEISGIVIEDSTDVLQEYYDAYEGFGLAKVFSRSS